MHTIHRMNDALSEQIRAYETMSNNWREKNTVRSGH
jgi:hypothetical protein